MTNDNRTTGNRLAWVLGCALFALLGGAAGWFWNAARQGPANKLAIEKVVHDYLMANPEVLPKAMKELQRRESAKQLAGVQDDVETPFPGAILGNPKGAITLVEFTDFACGYCRQSVGDIEALIAANPDLKIVIRELPILSESSADAARMALAAAEQGKYPAFHKAMFAAGRPDPATIDAAARAAGLDMTRARATIASPKVEAEIRRNLDMAGELGFSGTPSWVIGEELHSGAVGTDVLAEAIKRVRS